MKIAIIRLSALGDIIHTSIVIQFIKKHYKNADITWFVDEKFSSILRLISGINIATLPLKDKKFYKSYKKGKRCGAGDSLLRAGIAKNKCKDTKFLSTC